MKRLLKYFGKDSYGRIFSIVLVLTIILFLFTYGLSRSLVLSLILIVPLYGIESSFASLGLDPFNFVFAIPFLVLLYSLSLSSLIWTLRNLSKSNKPVFWLNILIVSVVVLLWVVSWIHFA